MNRLRQGGSARISFFSFQDIITSVTGILILVTLMLSFSMQSGEAEQTPESQFRAQTERLRELERQNEEIQRHRIEASSLPDPAELQSQMEALRRQQAQLHEQREQSDTSLEAVLNRVSKNKTVSELQSESTTLAAQLKSMQEKLAREKTNSNVVFIVPDSERQRMQKQPMAIVVNADKAAAQRLDGAEKQEIPISSPTAIAPLLARLNPQRDLVIFYFRPSGAKWFDGFRDLSRRAGFEIGYDAVEEQRPVVFTP
jgi:hypothetical protein